MGWFEKPDEYVVKPLGVSYKFGDLLRKSDYHLILRERLDILAAVLAESWEESEITISRDPLQYIWYMTCYESNPLRQHIDRRPGFARPVTAARRDLAIWAFVYYTINRLDQNRAEGKPGLL